MTQSEWFVELPVLLLVLLTVSVLMLIWLALRVKRKGQELAQLSALQAQTLATQNELQLSLQHAEQQVELGQERVDSAKTELTNIQARYEALTLRYETERESRVDSEKQVSTLSAKLGETEKHQRQFVDELDALKAKLDQEQSQYRVLLEKYSSLEASLDEREKGYRQQLSAFDDQKKLLEQSFQNLANRIFEEKGKTFSSTSKDSLEQLLKPFREQITEFRTRVDGIHKENNEATGSLRKELEQLRELNTTLTTDAKNLTDALKGDKKKVGSWGEIQLEKTLQQAGLVKGDHYDTQVQFKDQDGKNNYPDFIVRLPDNKHIILDSKVSLIDYDAASSAEDEEAQAVAMDRHVQAIRNHIDGLAAKDYSNLIGMKSPSFVLMFMPIEPAYIEAMKRNQELFNYGYQKNVILVSHTTLMPILRTVANLWMMERSNAEAREVSDKAGEVYNQVCVIAERLQKLGATLQTASKHYNSAVVAVAGQQGLHGKVERFSKLSSKVTKTMTEIEPLHMDIESERLSVISPEELPLQAEYVDTAGLESNSETK